MDKLSYEVLSLIVGHLDGPLASYATVSRAWQSVVETRTFTQVRVESDSMDTFATALGPSRDRRRKTLKKLYFEVRLPESNELRAEYRKNLAVFREAVTVLFQRLATWEGTDGRFELAIGTSRTEVYDNTRELEEQGFCVLDPSDTYGGRSAEGRRYLALRDKDLQTVLKVSCVNAFSVDNPYGFSIHPATGFLMARSFPGLQELSLSYVDPVKRRFGLRRKHRQAVADGVKSLRDLPWLRKLRITCSRNPDPADHGFELQDFGDHQSVDALCEALRGLAQAGRLAELHLEDTLVSPDLFGDRWPAATAAAAGAPDAPPAWPALERFSIRQGLAAPDGQWYGTGDAAAVRPGSPADTYGSPGPNGGRVYDSEDLDADSHADSDESSSGSDDDGDDSDADVVANGAAPAHYWRTAVDAAVFDPLARAMAAAVLAMPKLKSGRLELRRDPPRGLLPFALECAEAGEEMTWDQYVAPDPAAARVRRWRVVRDQETDWEPPEELLELWHEWVGPGGTAGTVVLEALDGYHPEYLWSHGVSWRLASASRALDAQGPP